LANPLVSSHVWSIVHGRRAYATRIGTELGVKIGSLDTDASRMYQCGHCKDLHFASEQARRCWELGDLELLTADVGTRR
jgi:hypothetical protein